MQIQTLEKSKQKQYSIISIIKKIESYTFRFDHPTQRDSGQWDARMKGNLISDILQNNPLPALVFAEQIMDGIVVTYNLDGKQKCTTVYAFINNEFRVSNNIRRWNIEYQTPIKDEDGQVVLSENGLPIFEKQEFDIRKKKFSELPEELQERFYDYTFECTQYLNCTDEEIEYHICRYNEGKPMTPAQKGMGGIGTEYAAMVKQISAMPFFRDCGDYKTSEFRNGTINRIVVESVMISNFLTDWKKKQEDMCSYIKKYATIEHFNGFEDIIERLEKVITEDLSEIFNSKDSFIWFGLFVKFVKMGLDDKKFTDFMVEFKKSLHSKIMDGISFDELNGKSTKDKKIVIGKISHLEKLMKEFLQIEKEEEAVCVPDELMDYVNGFSHSKIIQDCELKTKESINCVAMRTLAFIKENVNPEKIEEDVELYLSMLADWKLNISNQVKSIDINAIPSFVGIVGYACDKEADDIAEKWFIDFMKRNKIVKKNQKENYLHMVDSLNKYIQLTQKRAV